MSTGFIRLGAIIWKEFKQMRRDRVTLAMMLMVPVIQLLLFGYAIRVEVRNLPAGVYDESQTMQSRELARRFENTDNFELKTRAESYGELLRMIDYGKVNAGVVIPEDYARRIKSGRRTTVQVLVDAADPLASSSAIQAAQLVSQLSNMEAAVGSGRAEITPPLDVRVRPLYNPALRSAIFIVPGIIGVLLSMTMMMITAMAIVREKERGTMEQLIVTPLKKTELMIGKITPYVLVGYVQMTAVLLLGYLLFDVPLRGSLTLLYAVTFLFIVANLGLGLWVSTLVDNQQQAALVSWLLILPNILLSGFMFPRAAMPWLAEQIGLLLPLTYFLEVMRGILLKGVGMAAIWEETTALSGFALLFFAFSVRRFRKTLE